jgi:hypothetical protein
MKKFIFIRVEQPLALEIIGYMLCVSVAVFGTSHFINNPSSPIWTGYAWVVIATVAVGATYRMLIAHMNLIVSFVKKAYETITVFMCRLAGKRGDLIPREKTKYAVIGMSLFIPPIMAFITFPYLLSTIMGINGIKAYLFTIPLAFIIFIVDRAFVATMNYKKVWYGILARFILAVVLGMFLSKPIELKFFEKETTEELKDQKQKKLASIQSARDAKMSSLLQQEEDAKAEVERARQEYEKEVNFGYGQRGSGHGKEAEKKEKYFYEQDSLFRNTVLPVINKERATADSLFVTQTKEYENNQSYGFGARAQALDAAGEKYPAVAFVSWLLLISLIMLDLSPLLAKILMPKSQSDRVEETEEELSEHELKKIKINNKYAEMSAEINAAIKAIEDLQLPQQRKDVLITSEQRRLQRNYFGEEVLN